MRKMTMLNFCINFLNKAEKSLPILYDFAVASYMDAWIKTKGENSLFFKTKGENSLFSDSIVAFSVDAWIKIISVR